MTLVSGNIRFVRILVGFLGEGASNNSGVVTSIFSALDAISLELLGTRNHVAAECRNDMRPFVQLPSVSGADSKLGLTIV